MKKIIDLFLTDLEPDIFKKALENMAAQGKLDRLVNEEPDAVAGLKAAFTFSASKEGGMFWIDVVRELEKRPVSLAEQLEKMGRGA